MENEIIKEGRRGEYKRVHPSQVEVDHTLNSKIRPWGHTEEHINELALDMEENGQKEPVILHKNKGGDKPYKLATGYGRFLAGQRINDKWGNTPERVFYLKAIVEEGNEYDTFITNLSTNLFNAGMSHMEIAFAIKELYYYFGKTEQEIADKLHKHQSYVNLHRQLLNLNHDLQKQVHTGELSFTAALLICQQPETEQKATIEKATDEKGQVKIDAVKGVLRDKIATGAVEKAIKAGKVPPKSDSQTDEEYRAEVKEMLAEDVQQAAQQKKMRRSFKEIYTFWEDLIHSGPRGALAQGVMRFMDGQIDAEGLFKIMETNVMSKEEWMEYNRFKQAKREGMVA